VVDRDQDAADATAAMIQEEGGEAAAHQADLTEPAACDAMADEALARWGSIDILDNNVGVMVPGNVVDVAPEAWERVLGLNVLSVVNASRSVIPKMAAGGGGAIVNISSIAALRPRGVTPYSTTKGAVIALTHSMAVDHGPQGIRVNCIAPGPLYTPVVVAGGVGDADRERRRKASVLGVEGTGWDVGYAAAYLCSDQARYVTGVVLPVDGGVILRGPDR
jgi:NAD(P)-dependent dehydrogenase (short-subunit alcohol dehydrogenase family)